MSTPCTSDSAIGAPRARVSWPVPVRDMMRKLISAPGGEPNAHGGSDRRARARQSYFTEASLVVSVGEERHTLYLRDVVFLSDAERWSAGFIAGGPLAADLCGSAEICGLAPAPVPCECQLRRCREFAPGWCEGMVDFDFGRPAAAAA